MYKLTRHSISYVIAFFYLGLLYSPNLCAAHAIAKSAASPAVSVHELNYTPAINIINPIEEQLTQKMAELDPWAYATLVKLNQEYYIFDVAKAVFKRRLQSKLAQDLAYDALYHKLLAACSDYSKTSVWHENISNYVALIDRMLSLQKEGRPEAEYRAIFIDAAKRHMEEDSAKHKTYRKLLIKSSIRSAKDIIAYLKSKEVPDHLQTQLNALFSQPDIRSALSELHMQGKNQDKAIKLLEQKGFIFLNNKPNIFKITHFKGYVIKMGIKRFDWQLGPEYNNISRIRYAELLDQEQEKNPASVLRLPKKYAYFFPNADQEDRMPKVLVIAQEVAGTGVKGITAQQLEQYKALIAKLHFKDDHELNVTCHDKYMYLLDTEPHVIRVDYPRQPRTPIFIKIGKRLYARPGYPLLIIAGCVVIGGVIIYLISYSTDYKTKKKKKTSTKTLKAQLT